jgi:HEAT repeat protein
MLALTLLGGCGRREPVLSHGHPVSYWVEKLHDPDAPARKKAVVALGHAGTADPGAIPAVIGAVHDRDAGVRREAVLALLNLGPAAWEAVPALTEAQNDRDAQVRAYAVKASNAFRKSRRRGHAACPPGACGV